jgi:hypothetical protein
LHSKRILGRFAAGIGPLARREEHLPWWQPVEDRLGSHLGSATTHINGG